MILPRKTLLPLCLSTLLVAGCGGAVAPTSDDDDDSGTPGSDGGAHPNAVTFTQCTGQLVSTGIFYAGDDGPPGMAMTLAQTESTVSVGLLDHQGASDGALTFTLGPGSSANLSAPGATVTGATAFCSKDESQPPLSFSISGATYAGTTDGALVAMFGTATTTASSSACGAQAQTAAYVISCTGGDGDLGTAPLPPSSAPAPAFPLGSYACTGYVESRGTGSIGATGATAFDGIDATLSLTSTTGGVMATYQSSDGVAQGALLFDTTSPTTAVAVANQSVSGPCDQAPTVGVVPPAPPFATANVSTASITAVGSTLTLAYAGSSPASTQCPAANAMGTLVCTPK